MEPSEILRVRLPKSLADALRQQAKVLKVEKPDLARVALARGLMGMQPERSVAPQTEMVAVTQRIIGG